MCNYDVIISKTQICLPDSDTYQNGSSSPGSTGQSRYTEEFVLELQQELVKARLREAEATVQLNEAHERINQLEFENR